MLVNNKRLNKYIINKKNNNNNNHINKINLKK